MAAPDTWSEVGLVSISAQGGSDIEFATLTETVDIDIGEKGFESMATLGGGRLVKFTPQEDTTITLEAYPVEAGTNSGTTGKGFFDLLNTADASQPVNISVDRVRSKYRIALMWTDNVSITSASSQVGLNNTALRITASDGYFTSVKPSFTDNVLKFTVTYKVPPFDKSGSANVEVASVDTSATLAALNAYTSSTKGF